MFLLIRNQLELKQALEWTILAGVFPAEKH